jgi:uncharacterized membrane protein YagU involved in acid resistance
MNEFSTLTSKSARAAGNGSKQKMKGDGQEGEEDPTMKTAAEIAKRFTGIQLNQEQKKKGGTVVHYAFGAAMGGVYGAAAEYLPQVKSLAGLPYGAALFVGADEVVLPVLGLAKKPREYPPSRHLSGLGQHFVYGLTTEVVRRLMRDTL